MSKIKVTFIGGSWHGKTMTVNELAPTFRVPIPNRQSMIQDDELPVSLPHLLYEEYDVGGVEGRYRHKHYLYVYAGESEC